MGIGAVAEPLVVVTLLFGGTWVNRNKDYKLFGRRTEHVTSPRSSSPDSESGRSAVSSDSLLAGVDEVPKWRKREIRVLGFKTEVTSPNSRRFKDYFLSRLLRKFPFLVEAWYWALIYWVYQLGRAFSAVTMVEGTVNVARRHALQVIHLEQRLHIFHELDVQGWFIQHPLLLHWTNRIYSFIHIPGTILFLVFLFFYTTMQNRIDLPSYHQRNHGSPSSSPTREPHGSPAGPKLYEARRRTMATCNLIAFIVFTLWPCMPPRLLSDPDVPGDVGREARSFGFVDTVHGAEGESSVWTQNKFCNQYAAMPSLHFGYSLLVGLTIIFLPLAPQHQRSRTLSVRTPFAGKTLRLRLPSARRLACLVVGVAYPAIILVAIVATANHFILDAIAGAMVCGLAWTGNKVLLNLLPLEDYFLWCVRIHKPERRAVLFHDREDDERVLRKGVVVR